LEAGAHGGECSRERLGTRELWEAGAGDEGVSGDDESPLIERSAGDVDAGRGRDLGPGAPVVGDQEIAGGRAEILGIVPGAGDGERLGEASGARGEKAELGGTGIVREGESAVGGHLRQSADGFEGAEKDASGVSRRLATDVGAEVVSVDEIDVSMAGRAEEDGVAGGESAVGVRAGIGESEIGFGFNDASGKEDAFIAADEKFAEEFASDKAGIAGEEGARERGDTGEGAGGGRHERGVEDDSIG